MDVLYVDYNKLMANPEGYGQTIADFIGLHVDVARMLSVPERTALPESGAQALIDEAFAGPGRRPESVLDIPTVRRII